MRDIFKGLVTGFLINSALILICFAVSGWNTHQLFVSGMISQLALVAVIVGINAIRQLKMQRLPNETPTWERLWDD